MADKQAGDDAYSDEETERRMNAAVLKALSAPPQPRCAPKNATAKGAAPKPPSRAFESGI